MNALEKVPATSQEQHYILAYVDHRGRSQVHDAWLPFADISSPAGRDRVKAALLADRLSADPEDVVNIDYFDAAVVCVASGMRAACAPDPDIQVTLPRRDVCEGSPPGPDEPSYALHARMSSSGNSLYVDLRAMGDSPAREIDRRPGLFLHIEISGGAPCVHVHASESPLMQSIFAISGDQLVFRKGDADPEYADQDFMPDQNDIAQLFLRSRETDEPQ